MLLEILHVRTKLRIYKTQHKKTAQNMCLPRNRLLDLLENKSLVVECSLIVKEVLPF